MRCTERPHVENHEWKTAQDFSYPFDHKPPRLFTVANDDGVEEIDEVLPVVLIQLAHDARI